jgi:hypothetical protein
MAAAVPPLPQYIFVEWYFVMHRGNFTFFLHDPCLRINSEVYSFKSKTKETSMFNHIVFACVKWFGHSFSIHGFLLILVQWINVRICLTSCSGKNSFRISSAHRILEASKGICNFLFLLDECRRRQKIPAKAETREMVLKEWDVFCK